jgi:hypothetical protein
MSCSRSVGIHLLRGAAAVGVAAKPQRICNWLGDFRRSAARRPRRMYGQRLVALNPGIPGNSAPACFDICSCICVNILRDCSR